MRKLRFFAALFVGKLSYIALRILRRGGTFMPGSLALKICPDFLHIVPVPQKIVAVTGTNGKSTVVNMLYDILSADRQRVLCNRQGANKTDGIAAMFVRGLSLFGKCRHDICVMEADELNCGKIFRAIKPQLIIVTNLSRDTIERDKHIEYVRDVLNASIPEKTALLLNADDPFSAFIAPSVKRVYFGLDALPSDPEPDSFLLDARLCPRCRRKLTWELVHYSDIGRAFCPSCGLRLPERDFLGTKVDAKNMTFELREKDGSCTLRLPDSSVFNIYNAITVSSALRILGYDRKKIADAFRNLEIAESRFRRFRVGKTEVRCILTKEWNPSASSRTYEYIRSFKCTKEIVFMNTSRPELSQISENVAWLYDSNAELLNDPGIRNIILYGSRTADQMLRLLIAGVPKEKILIAEKAEEIAEKLICRGTDTVFILFGIDNYLSKTKSKVESAVMKALKEYDL